MIIDIIFAILVVLAIFKGFSRGLVLGVFSLVAVLVGLAAAIKLSAVVAGYIGSAVKVSDKWLPIISFIIVFIIVILLIRLGAKAIEKVLQVAMLGWLNRLGGILLYVVIYILVFSILLFYADQINLIRPVTKEASICYDFVSALGPWAIDGFGTILPFFRNMFSELQLFFDGLSREAASL